MRLTDQTVRSLPHPENGQQDYTDDLVRGLMVRVGKRAKTFIVTTGPRERRKRHTLGRYDPPHFTLARRRGTSSRVSGSQKMNYPAPPSRTR
jgi:hypothetical protein